MLALSLVVFGVSTAPNRVTAMDDQVPFTGTATAVITSVTKLPGGLTQINLDITGNATHMGDLTGSSTRIEDNQGNSASSGAFIAANGKGSIFFTISGQFVTSRDKCMVTSTGTYTATGGTGAFANATGSGTVLSEFDVCAGIATGTYSGTISKPNSN